MVADGVQVLGGQGLRDVAAALGRRQQIVEQDGRAVAEDILERDRRRFEPRRAVLFGPTSYNPDTAGSTSHNPDTAGSTSHNPDTAGSTSHISHSTLAIGPNAEHASAGAWAGG